MRPALRAEHTKLAIFSYTGICRIDGLDTCHLRSLGGQFSAAVCFHGCMAHIRLVPEHSFHLSVLRLLGAGKTSMEYSGAYYYGINKHLCWVFIGKYFGWQGVLAAFIGCIGAWQPHTCMGLSLRASKN